MSSTTVVRVLGGGLTFLLAFFLLRVVGLLAHTAYLRLRSRSTAATSTSSLGGAPLPSSARPLRTLLVLGSGGHTAELLSLVSHLPRGVYEPRTFVRADTDLTSEARVRQAEAHQLKEAGLTAADYPPSTFVAIPRSREVGQSYRSSIRTTLVAIAAAAKVVLEVKPQVVSTRERKRERTHAPHLLLPLLLLICFCFFLFRPSSSSCAMVPARAFPCA